MSPESPEFRHNALKITLQKTVEAFSATQPNTKEEQLAAQRLVEDIIFDRFFSYVVKEEDWAPYIGEIRKAADILAESLIKEAHEGGMRPDDVRYRLGLMLERGFIDPTRNPLIRSFLERTEV